MLELVGLGDKLSTREAGDVKAWLADSVVPWSVGYWEARHGPA